MVASPSLTARAFYGLLWLVSSLGTVSLFRFASLAILARLLAPAEFGLITEALVVVGLSGILSELGIGAALVQRVVLTDDHRHTAYTLSALLGLMLSGTVFVFSPIISKFFEEPRLTEILQVLSLAFIPRSMAVPSEALLQRDLCFQLLARIEVSSAGLGFLGISVLLAWQGFGVWSLVAGFLTEAFVRSALLLCVTRQWFGIGLKQGACLDLLGFGLWITAARIANYLALQGDYVVVGKTLGTTALGEYSRAFQLFLVPVGLMGQVLSRVLYPAFSRLQHDDARIKEYYKKSVTLVATIATPAGAIMAILAPEIITVILGKNWDTAVLPFQVLASGLLFRMGYKMTSVLLSARGNLYQQAWREGLYAVLVVFGALAGCGWGITGVAVGVLGAIVVHYLLMADAGNRVISLTWDKFFRAHIPAIILTIVCAASTWVIAATSRWLQLQDLVIVMSALLGTSLVTISMIFRAPGCFGKEVEWLLTVIEQHSLRPLAMFLTRLRSHLFGK